MNNLATEGRTLSGFQGLASKIKASLNSLIESSKGLQKAIIKKDIDTIWKILADQQESINEFEKYNHLWGQLSAAGISSPGLPAVKDEINSDIKRLRETGKGNARLIMSFLSAIKRAMKHTGTDIASKTKVYGKSGKMHMKQVSLKVNCVG
ncbi:MAG: hypothetical protein A2020_04450 [Lentisphaerae bacterium GWF2_45_14]|nr:MAG: hypothetical protein A2020_04450 [Lentisphaerae bacterium GWF2_45_14]